MTVAGGTGSLVFVLSSGTLDLVGSPMRALYVVP